MHIVSMTDDNFVPPYAAMLHSAWLFHPKATYWLLALGIGDLNRRLLTDFASSLGITLHIVDVSDAELAGFRVRPEVTVATYVRLFVPRLLPDSVERALVLDADLTIVDGLEPLFSIDLKGMPVAAANERSRWSEADAGRLNLPAGATYCNTGVMVMDLAAWRREGWGERTLAFIREASDTLEFLDQSALNAVFATRILILPIRWNLAHLDRWQEALPPAIIHYIARQKPWLDPESPFSDLYRFHQERTPFRAELQVTGLMTRLRRDAAALLGLPRNQNYRRMRKRKNAIRRAIAVPALDRAKRMLAARSPT